MRLIVDGVSSNEYPDRITIGDLLRLKDIEAVPWLVISVNDIFIKREYFDETYLNDKDRIELIYIRGGG
jgi:thiamine biosynthesis protein ThiS